MIDASQIPGAWLPREAALDAMSARGPASVTGAGAGQGQAADAQAMNLARDAYGAASVPGQAATPGVAESLLTRLDHLDRQFLKSIGSPPKVDLAEAGTPEGMMKLSSQLLEHQASLTRATVGISMVSTGTTSFRDGVKQVLSSQ